MDLKATNQLWRTSSRGLHKHANPRGVAQVLMAVVIAFLALSASAFSDPSQTISLTLAWDPSPSPEVTSYHVYVGTEPGVYDDAYNAGASTTYSIPNLVRGVTYYFSATALDVNGVESAFSAELEYTVPVLLDPADIKLSMQNGLPSIHGTSTPGSYFIVEASEDMQNWFYAGDAYVGDDGQVNYSDPDAPWHVQRFYRFQRLNW